MMSISGPPVKGVFCLATPVCLSTWCSRAPGRVSTGRGKARFVAKVLGDADPVVRPYMSMSRVVIIPNMKRPDSSITVITRHSTMAGCEGGRRSMLLVLRTGKYSAGRTFGRRVRTPKLTKRLPT